MMGRVKPGSRFGAIAHVMLVLGALFLVSGVSLARAADQAQEANGTQVLEAFDRQQVQRVKDAGAVSDHNKQVIMFSMGIPLVILLLITGGLGLATGVYGKQLFIPHMICAGLTVTLAVAHVIVGVVWFFPF
jgi:hypothetical protein